MVEIDLLKNHPNSIPRCAEIWHECLGKIWVPDISLEQVRARFQEHLNEAALPLTLVALDGDSRPIGMCSLRENDGIRPDLTPWLGSLVVAPQYQNQGIGYQLIEAIKNEAKKLNFSTLYLFAFDPTIPNYYSRLGWVEMGMDEFKGHPVTVMKIDLTNQ